MSSSVLIVLATTMAVMVLVTFWRKVLMLMVSVAIAIFFYGLMALTDLITT